MKLGSFGAAVREFEPDGERDEFEFCGEMFTVEGPIPPMLLLQLGAALTGKIGEAEGNAAVWEALRCSLTGQHADADGTQFDRFYRLAVDRVCELDELLRLVLVLAGAQSGKAREPRPSSPDGSPATSASSSSSASDSPDSPMPASAGEGSAG